MQETFSSRWGFCGKSPSGHGSAYALCRCLQVASFKHSFYWLLPRGGHEVKKPVRGWTCLMPHK